MLKKIRNIKGNLNGPTIKRYMKNKITSIKIDCMKNVDDEPINEGEEEEANTDKRETWTGRFDFFLSALAYAGSFNEKILDFK
jgi:hypothetical protein